MVMFKARFRPLADDPGASDKPRAQQQQQQQQQPQPTVPPIEKERGPQYPVKEPGPKSPPERAR
ncbi:MAG TPA: hypothetical protein VF522_18120 [Ramlibacter sp.]|uniref:hypothetical protein n=1 Tax=Ramlibacter sp. TaxID=1917967 RepID=UPI002ED54356